MKKVLIWLPLAGATAYLFLHFRRQAKLIKESCFKVVNAQVKKIGLYNSEINIKVLYKNKSDIDFTVSNQTYEVSVEGKKVSTIRNDKKYDIAPTSEAAMWLNVKFDPSKVLEASGAGIKDILFNKGDVDIAVKGSISVASGGVFFSKINIDETMKLRDMLKEKPDEKPC
jgi:LEA14-like dessication related protein